MAYIVMDCLESYYQDERGLLITVIEYESNDPINLTGAANFQEVEEFIAYLKEKKEQGFTDMYTEQDSLDNFTAEELHQMEEIISIKFY